MKKAAIIIASVVGLLFAGLLGYIFWLNYGLWAIAVWAAMILALPFSSLMHELGHMLVGSICKIKAVPKFKLFGSSCCELIPKTDKKLKWRLIFTARGGLIINVLLFILGQISLSCAAVPVWLALFMPANIYLYILNDFPVELNGGKTDGLVSWELYTETDNAKVLIAVLTVQARVLKGTPIEQIDRELLFGVPQIQEDDPAFISLTELRYEYFNALGDTENAEKYKARFEELKKEYM